MLENSNKMLEDAKVKSKPIFQFNVNNLEWAKYILEACQSVDTPVILGFSHGAIKYMGGYNVAVAIVKSLLIDLEITIPVSIHLDHGKDYESCVKAIDAGFTSVMIDASKESLERNIEITNQVIEYAKKYNVSVEGEIGTIGGTEDDVNGDIAYAKYEDVIKYVESTNIDMIAPALGSVHGLYKGEPKMDFDRMNQIASYLKNPVVLHGGSGLSDEIIANCIKNGITKINVNTQLQIDWSKDVKDYVSKHPETIDPRKIISAGEKAIKETIIAMIKKF